MPVERRNIVKKKKNEWWWRCGILIIQPQIDRDFRICLFENFASPDNLPHGNSYGSLSPFMPTILPKSEKADFFTIYYWTLKDVRNIFPDFSCFFSR